MNYQVLARKWRPKTFQEMVGQEHVLRALVNALNNNRLHHAYLFTGTRGVGKTSIARLFAKSLNCEAGVSANSCGQCGSCLDIAKGCFIDLIEVDAASRTKIEDTRELLENIQYAPTQGRFKVYLIDEVHMLSTHSFNALLKTLEEPPSHVKFLLATTDPQKLPVTILSRCLQFNLKNMLPDDIQTHLQHILNEEQISYETPALWHLARSASGSMRDALSLTDQAIAFGQGSIKEADVQTMLGSIDSHLIYPLLQALVAADGQTLLNSVKNLAQFSPDYSQVLADMISLLHRIALAQVMPNAVDNSLGDKQQVLTLAQSMTAEEVQLYYQTALMGRKDLGYAADAREALEMTLLRMLVFRPAGSSIPVKAELKIEPQSEQKPVVQEQVVPEYNQVVKQQSADVPKEFSELQLEHWVHLFKVIDLNGLTSSLASNLALESIIGGRLTFHYTEAQEMLLNEANKERIQQALAVYFDCNLVLDFKLAPQNHETPLSYWQQHKQTKVAEATQKLEQDPLVQRFKNQFGAELDSNSVLLKDS